MKIVISLILALSLTACNQKKNLSNPVSVSTSTEAKETSMSFDNSCFEGRAVTKEVTDVEVKMTEVMDMFMFTHDNMRWQACEVPVAFQKEGMMVKVSGQVLEIKPNERRAGTPFKITALTKM